MIFSNLSEYTCRLILMGIMWSPGHRLNPFFPECRVIFSSWSGVWVWMVCLSVNMHINGLKCLTFYHDHSLSVPTLLTLERKFICIRYCVGQCISKRPGPVMLQGKIWSAPFLWKWTLITQAFSRWSLWGRLFKELFSYQSLLIKLYFKL